LNSENEAILTQPARAYNNKSKGSGSGEEIINNLLPKHNELFQE